MRPESLPNCDDANRPLWIEHQDAAEEVVYRVDYIWTLDNLVEQRVESDAVAGTIAIVDFDYDNRHRLIHESRTVDTTPVYDLSYEYDQLGNRTKTTDNISGRYTLYAYDTMVECRSEQYPTNNNRLLMYAVFDEPGAEICGETWLPVMGPTEEPPEIAGPDPVRVVWYTYWDNGDVANITIRDAADPHVRKDLSLCYNGNGTLWLAIWDEWALEQVEGQWVYDEGSYVRTKAREFRFDTARARYLARDVDVATLQPIEGSGALNLWTDYLGETALLDYQVDYVDEWHTTVTERRAYLAGFGPQAYQNLPAGETFYLHDDLIGSTVQLTDESGGVGVPPASVAYTAFGELVTGSSALATRYGYGGAWGYEADLLELQGPDPSLAPVSLLHVGWRWYQPSIGRFVQRDPIGLEGGLDVYEYLDSDPLAQVDPSGLINDGAGTYVPYPIDPIDAFLFLTGGRGRVPVMDPGTAQNVVLITAEVVSVAAPAGAVGKVVSATPKCLKLIRTGRFGKYLVRIRKYIRYDRHPPHPDSPFEHWDGEFPRWLKGMLEEAMR